MSTELVKSAINTDSAGLLKPENLGEAFRLAQYYAASGLLPERYKTPEHVLTAMQFALELRLKPLTALRQISVVKNTPCVWGDLPLAMCYASKLLVRINEKWFDKNMKEISVANKNLKEPVYAATCEAWRAGDPDPISTFFTMDDAVQAGLTANPVWGKYPKRMLRYRARSQALKDKFPDCLNGIGIGEYDHNKIEEQMINVTPGSEAQDSADVSEVEVVQETTSSSTPPKPSLADRLKAKNDTQVIDAQIN